ncbi:MAG TPA: hypothetical protein VL633_07360 [Bacteroidota bacterium]|jgi:hypothetical protein|nr:hypothetical protein [Bacteroidota bacterium]
MHSYSLDGFLRHSDRVEQIRKHDVRPGDRLLVKTCNSVYSILMSQNGECTVTGGWFDRKGVSPMRTRIAGCTWGGSVINMNMIAARGLRMEFGNRLVTTSIQSVFVLPVGTDN